MAQNQDDYNQIAAENKALLFQRISRVLMRKQDKLACCISRGNIVPRENKGQSDY